MISKSFDTASYRRQASSSSSQSAVDQPPPKKGINADLLDKMEKAKMHLVTKSRTWGKMSPMMLATKSKIPNIISHEMCRKVVDDVWIHGRVKYKVRKIHLFFESSYENLIQCAS